MTKILITLALLLLFGAFEDTVHIVYASSSSCDEDSVSASIPVSKLTPNQFYKICPDQLLGGWTSLGNPICGDGTEFSFFFSKPVQRKANDDKLLIEFMGGGACWSEQTCDYNADSLTFPENLNDFVGNSCSEIAYAVQDYDDMPISMLCSRSIGDTDFSEYNTIVVPYCTQDVHLGDQTTTYDDGSTINHYGGHNMMAVLRWIFKNFKTPSHIALTGCSAGGTALPVAYDLLRKHYNKGIGGAIRTVQISTVMDSPVYLTPSYFLENGFPNWNPKTIMERIGFNFNKWQYSDDYPTRVMNNVLKRGSNKDQWGFVSHTNDPVSQIYYQYMSGYGEDDGNDGDGNNNGRHLDENDNEWYSATISSLNEVKKKHKNMNDYYIDGDSHCSFGLYYPLLDDGFESWAANIFKEQRIFATTPAVPMFWVSIGFGAMLFASVLYFTRKKERQIELNDNNQNSLLSDKEEQQQQQQQKRSFNMCGRFCGMFMRFPVTAGYMLAVTIYFWGMIASQGFAHPLNNPSLGPNAISLSAFGINNPSLIVYNGQIYRLISSSLLCSGVLTYLILILCLLSYARHLEIKINSPVRFGLIAVLISLGSNVFYAALTPGGGSCSSMALVLGLNTVCIILRRRQRQPICGIVFVTILLTILVSLIFPFNNWIMLLSGIGIGAIIARFIVVPRTTGTTDATCNTSQQRKGDGVFVSDNDSKSSSFGVHRKAIVVVGVLLASMTVFVIFLRHWIYRPNQLYLQPYYTGCDLMYAKGEDVADIMDNYNLDGGERRRLDYDYEALCAEFCLPHLVANAALFGAPRIVGLPLSQGQCDEIGFDEHMADKTFSQFSYSLDVEIFTSAEQENDDEDR